ncbi:U-Kazal-Dg21.2-like [Episyrphus balteatus]|uniref:U-Kazal-Dg21.2-like n=1 Tax=Episyrphus balteatus TaxID=286459 RepID=UPI002486A360|nr:U-Kazal-Dg21.2-like [Episyrphus balteatus]
MVSHIETATIKRCNLQFKCSLVDQSVSATDGKKCYVFRNSCLLASKNCQRKNECKSELRVITREKCKSLCTRFCPAIYKPVCCYDGKVEKSFSSGCELERYICETGKTCSSTQTGKCDCDL